MVRITLANAPRVVGVTVAAALMLLIAACGGGSGSPGHSSGSGQPVSDEPAVVAPVAVGIPTSPCALLTDQEIVGATGVQHTPFEQSSHEGRTLDCTWADTRAMGPQVGTQVTCDPEIIGLHDNQNSSSVVLRDAPVETRIMRMQYGSSIFAKKQVGQGECWMSVTAALVNEATIVQLFDAAYGRLAA